MICLVVMLSCNQKFGGDAPFPFMICLVVMLSYNLKSGCDAPFPFMICLVVMLSNLVVMLPSLS